MLNIIGLILLVGALPLLSAQSSTTTGKPVPVPTCSSDVCNNATTYYSDINTEYKNTSYCPFYTGTTGLYELNINGKSKIVMCENGFMVWQRRYYGDNTSFNCSHAQYEGCLGNPMQAYWLGLEDMAWMSYQSSIYWRIELKHCNGQIYTRNYNNVQIGYGPEYRLTFDLQSNPLSNCSANDPGDSFDLPQMSSGTLYDAPFYTYDTASGDNPPALYAGGFWQSSSSMLGTNINAEPVSPQTNKCISGGYNMNWFTLGPLLNCNTPDCPSIYCGTNLVASKILAQPS